MKIKADYTEIQRRQIPPGKYVLQIRSVYDRERNERSFGKAYTNTYLHFDLFILGEFGAKLDGSNWLYGRKVPYEAAIKGPYAYKLKLLTDSVNPDLSASFDTKDLIGKKVVALISPKGTNGKYTGFPQILKFEPYIYLDE